MENQTTIEKPADTLYAERPPLYDMARILHDTAPAEPSTSYLHIYTSLMLLLTTFFIAFFAFTMPSSLQNVLEMLKTPQPHTIISYLKFKKSFLNQGADGDGSLIIALGKRSKELEEELKGCQVIVKTYETRIVIPTKKIFSTGSIELSKKAHSLFNTIIDYVTKEGYAQVIISAYDANTADEYAATSEERDTLLPTVRAIAIAHYFVANQLDDTRVVVAGHAYPYPHNLYQLDSPQTDAHRMEIIIKKKTPVPYDSENRRDV
ncbi:MAG: OmpA family protein [Candidatus Omnitrophica bacterium]|nr:OmpA family protein [Candidatus Omnitrophota bacterium]